VKLYTVIVIAFSNNHYGLTTSHLWSKPLGDHPLHLHILRLRLTRTIPSRMRARGEQVGRGRGDEAQHRCNAVVGFWDIHNRLGRVQHGHLGRGNNEHWSARHPAHIHVFVQRGKCNRNRSPDRHAHHEIQRRKEIPSINMRDIRYYTHSCSIFIVLVLSTMFATRTLRKKRWQHAYASQHQTQSENSSTTIYFPTVMWSEL